MRADPASEFALVQFAGGESYNGVRCVACGCRQALAVKRKKDVHRLEGDPLVAVDEWTVGPPPSHVPGRGAIRQLCFMRLSADKGRGLG